MVLVMVVLFAVMMVRWNYTHDGGGGGLYAVDALMMLNADNFRTSGGGGNTVGGEGKWCLCYICIPTHISFPVRMFKPCREKY